MQKNGFTCYGEVEGGKLKLKNRTLLRQRISGLRGKVQIHFQEDKEKPRCSTQQHRYYRGFVLPPIAEHLGYTKKEAHDALKWEILVDTDCPLPKVPSTADFSTTEFVDFVDKSRQLAADELKIFIPLPDEYGFNFYLPSQYEQSLKTTPKDNKTLSQV